jgi:ATPase family associated with various cellular activities (AAA)
MNFAASTVNIGATTTWMEANQRYLMDALAVVRGHLEAHGAHKVDDSGPVPIGPAPADSWPALSFPPAIDAITATLGLSTFERDLLLLCAGVELDTGFTASCTAAQGDPKQRYPTFALALSVLPGAHWSALSPSGPLRHFRLVEVGVGDTLTGSPLRIDERVLHYLVGETHLDQRLARLVEPVRQTPAALVPSHRVIASRIAATWARVSAWGSAPIVQLSGPDRDGKCAVAAAACADIGASLYALPAQLAGGDLDEATVARLLTREVALGGIALLVDCDDLDGSDVVRSGSVSRLLDRVAGPLLVTTRERGRVARRPALVFDVAKPTAAEQRTLWTAAIGGGLLSHGLPDPSPGAAPALAPTIDVLVSQFDLGAAAIELACATAQAGQDAAGDPGGALWDACRLQARPRFDDLAQRVEATAGWDDLVLPEVQRNVLREIAVHVRQRAKVYEAWGFASKGGRGLGVSALFAGVSGTGKTMAAEVLAAALRLDLYRIDLSSVVSKYIGETEKNLRRVFDAAEEAAAILLFDEADAIFGKRSEVKDSHDRYANMEVSYLLQRMEAYRGLAILTTNMKSALDTAFLRRIRFVVQFPYPEAEQRAAIWARVFPPGTPTEGLNVQKLARLNVAGGNIRNIAINAAFLAAEAGGPVRMTEVMRAARSEYAKMERPMTRELEE